MAPEEADVEMQCGDAEKDVEMADPELTAALAELMACSRRQLVAKFKQSNTPVWVAVQNRGEDVRSCL